MWETCLRVSLNLLYSVPFVKNAGACFPADWGFVELYDCCYKWRYK